MTYNEFTQLSGFPFIPSDLYHNEVEEAYVKYVGTKEEFCKIIQNMSDYPILLDGFLSSLIWGYDDISDNLVSYEVTGHDEKDCYTIKFNRHFYTKTAAIFQKFECSNIYPDFKFHIR